MAVDLIVRPAARRDLIAIGEYIEYDSPQRAAKLVAEINAKIAQLVHLPLSYPAWRYDRHGSLRAARRPPYVIFFRFDGRSVTVVRIVHSRRNLDAIFPRR